MTNPCPKDDVLGFPKEKHQHLRNSLKTIFWVFGIENVKAYAWKKKIVWKNYIQIKQNFLMQSIRRR